MIKPVYVNDNESDEFDVHAETITNFLDMSFSEFVREAILNGELRTTETLPEFYGRENSKTPAKYLILAVR